MKHEVLSKNLTHSCLLVHVVLPFTGSIPAYEKGACFDHGKSHRRNQYEVGRRAHTSGQVNFSKHILTKNE